MCTNNQYILEKHQSIHVQPRQLIDLFCLTTTHLERVEHYKCNQFKNEYVLWRKSIICDSYLLGAYCLDLCIFHRFQIYDLLSVHHILNHSPCFWTWIFVLTCMFNSIWKKVLICIQFKLKIQLRKGLNVVVTEEWERKSGSNIGVKGVERREIEERTIGQQSCELPCSRLSNWVCVRVCRLSH